MWILYLGITLFYTWPLLVALACWLLWQMTKKTGWKRGTWWMIAAEGIWILGNAFVILRSLQ
mgnify:CR=1 FL=1